MNSDQRRDRAWYWAGAGFCVLMFGIHIAAARNIVGIPDFWRDMYWATSIAHAERFPLAGPPIYHLIELGPWWYYLLALPIVIANSITAAAVFAQLLVAAKYVLAWRLGTRAIDARFGLAFAVCLAVAGWSTASLVFPTHTGVVETTLLLLAAATWRCHDRLSVGNLLLFGLAGAACIHAHPSTAPYLIFAGVIVLFRHRSPTTLLWLGLAVAIVLLSLAPPFLDRPIEDEPGFGPPKTFAAYASHDLMVNVWSRVPDVLAGLSTGGSWTGFMQMTPWSMPVIRIAFAIHCACLVFALCGLLLLRRDPRRLVRWFCYALVILFVQCAFLLLIRDGTPVWMTQSCLVPLALAVALGWYGWFTAAARLWLGVAIGVFVVYATLSLAPFQRYVREVHVNRIMPDSNPFAGLNGGGATFEEHPIPFFPVSRLDRLGPSLCEPMVLHARLAAAVEHALATPARNACGFWPKLHYAGIAPGARHVAGIAARAVSAIGIREDRLVAGLAWYENVRAIAPPHGQDLTRMERFRVMPNATFVGFLPATYEFDARSGDVVALTNRFDNQIAPMVIHRITSNGQPARAVFNEGDQLIYACSGCTGNDPTHWHIDLEGVEENLDIVVIPVDRATTPAG